ncbi:MAG: hypothetical protein ACTSYM_10050 [Candidatus Baldrarchaeia archaeon]
MLAKGVLKLVLEKETTITREGRSGAKIYIPADIVKDSQFPFEIGEKVLIKIDIENSRLIVEKIKKNV